MKNDITKKLLNVLNGRPIAIWGARMTGIGFLRFAKKNNLNIVGFVDSDTSLDGTNICNLPVILPQKLSYLKTRHKDLVVVIAVSIKEDEIIDILDRGGMSSKDYVLYKDFCKIFFTIDIVGACNLKCPSCANSICSTKRPKGLMSFNDFKNIINKIVKETGLASHICLYNWGEPLLHPKIDLFIDYAHKMGIAVAVSTNFSINSPDQLYKIVKSSPDIFKVSVSGYYPNIYNTTHTGGDINLVKSNLYRLKYYMEKNNSSFPVEVNYHLYRNNKGEDLKKTKELCKELGFILSTCNANFTPVERIIEHYEGKTDKKTKEFMKLLPVSVDDGLKMTKPFRHLPCRYLQNQMNINWDRTVSLCCACYDRQGTIISKDFLLDSLPDIQKQKNNHNLCKKCIKYGINQYLLRV